MKKIIKPLIICLVAFVVVIGLLGVISSNIQRSIEEKTSISN